MFHARIILCLVATVYAQNSSVSPSNVDLVFVLDGSGSVGKSGFEEVKRWVKATTQGFNLETTYVGVIQYSHYFASRKWSDQGFMKTEIPLGRHTGRQAFEASVDGIFYQGFTTYTAHAILKAVSDFKTSDRFQDGDTKKVMILVTDGRSSDSSQLQDSAKKLRAANISSYAVGVGRTDDRELEIIAGSRSRVFHVSDFSSLGDITSDIVNGATGTSQPIQGKQT